MKKEVIERIRQQYPKGTRVELVRMEDPQAPPVGTKGTVMAVDDIGTIHVKWDNGSSLGIAYGADQCRILDGDFTETVREQILEIRDTGLTNMFDLPMVQRLAFDRDYYELVIYIEEHPKEYARFIMTGEMS